MEKTRLSYDYEAAMCLQQGLYPVRRTATSEQSSGSVSRRFWVGRSGTLDIAGIGQVVSEMENLSATQGPRFEPAPILVHMAEHEEKFYRND